MELSPFFAASQRLRSLALMIQSKTVRPQVLPLAASIQERAVAKGIAGVSASMFGGTIARRFLKCPELPVITAETVKRFAGMGGRYV
jgi:hypothetical protein